MGAERIESRCVLWAAGVRASTLSQTLGAPLDKAGRVVVERDLSIPGAPDAFAIGDLAAVPGVPGVAQGAIQGGRHAARQILRRTRGEPTEPFRYVDKGSLATIGRAAAIAQLGKLHMTGFVAWVLWLLVHIVTLIGFRNRFVVMVDWAVAYLTWQRSARLILGGVERTTPGAAPPG